MKCPVLTFLEPVRRGQKQTRGWLPVFASVFFVQTKETAITKEIAMFNFKDFAFRYRAKANTKTTTGDGKVTDKYVFGEGSGDLDVGKEIKLVAAGKTKVEVIVGGERKNPESYVKEGEHEIMVATPALNVIGAWMKASKK